MNLPRLKFALLQLFSPDFTVNFVCTASVRELETLLEGLQTVVAATASSRAKFSTGVAPAHGTYCKAQESGVCILSVGLSSPGKTVVCLWRHSSYEASEGALRDATVRARRHHPSLCLHTDRVHVVPCAVLFRSAPPM